jgi:hypothetical protein
VFRVPSSANRVERLTEAGVHGLSSAQDYGSVVLVAVEERGRDQTALAEHVGLSGAQVYASLFAARRAVLRSGTSRASVEEETAGWAS